MSARLADRYDIAAWILTGIALTLVLVLHLLPALIGGLLVYELVHVLTRAVIMRRLASVPARMLAVILLSIAIIAIISLVVLGVVAFLRSDAGSLSALMKKLAEILDASRNYLPAWMVADLPTDAEEARSGAARWLRAHAADVQTMGRSAARVLGQLVIGMIIGAMVSLRDVQPDQELGALAAALRERVRRVAEAFRRIVFAQVRIAAINAGLTALYVAVALPLLGMPLPFGKTLVIVTFICGLIPVVGNLISNTVIVMVSLSQSVSLAIASLVFLVIIHKLEYFLNARIVGTRISARPWELLIAMLAMEGAFGVAGLVAAPIYYAYLKDELDERGVI
jgi:predicted PurR-regulated permease PerM